MSRDATTRAWIALGSNLGDRAACLARGREGLRGAPGLQLIATTPVEDTAPLDGRSQPNYLNQMALVATTLGPAALLALCHDIERGAGRDRSVRWASRTLDLDLVRFGDLLCDLPSLTLPHPGLRDRLFWAREIAILEAHG